MTSKKTAAQKRTSPPRNSDRTKQFDKDWQRLSASGRYDMHKLKEAMLLLIANDGPLPAELENKAEPLAAKAGCFPCPCVAAGTGRVPLGEPARCNEAA